MTMIPALVMTYIQSLKTQWIFMTQITNTNNLVMVTPLLWSRSKRGIKSRHRLPKVHPSLPIYNLIYEWHDVFKRLKAMPKLISYMDESGISFRRISASLNRSSFKTHRGKTWSETGVHANSVVKRMKERQERIAQGSKARFSTSISNFSISHL